MAQIHKFDTLNSAGLTQYVAHKVRSRVSSCPKISMWFSAAGLVDAEAYDRAGRARGVVKGSTLWHDLEAKIPALIRVYEAAA